MCAMDSLKIKRFDKAIHLKFISLGSGYYPTHYSFYVQISPEENEAKIQHAEAEAWENNVVLNVHLENGNAERIATYLSGLDSDHLQKYVIQEKFKVSHKSRQRQKESTSTSSQSSLDISIERSECEKQVEIEMKSRPTDLMSTCNANTTEDDEDNSTSATGDAACFSPQNQKKVNKKQKRKNKTRRALSKSACDDIKTYQQLQQLQNLIPPPVANMKNYEIL